MCKSPDHEFAINLPSNASDFRADAHDDPEAVLNHQRLNYVEHNFSEMYFILS